MSQMSAASASGATSSAASAHAANGSSRCELPIIGVGPWRQVNRGSGGRPARGHGAGRPAGRRRRVGSASSCRPARGRGVGRSPGHRHRAGSATRRRLRPGHGAYGPKDHPPRGRRSNGRRTSTSAGIGAAHSVEPWDVPHFKQSRAVLRKYIDRRIERRACNSRERRSRLRIAGECGRIGHRHRHGRRPARERMSPSPMATVCTLRSNVRAGRER
jgi:hypothetical protein